MTRLHRSTAAALSFLVLSAPAYSTPRIYTAIGGTQVARSFTGTQWSSPQLPLAEWIEGFPAWGGPSYIRTGDFNGDGLLDIASPSGGVIMVKYQATGGHCGNYICLASLDPIYVTDLWGGAEYTWVGDFNGDNKDDIASAVPGTVHMKLSTFPAPFGEGFASQEWSVSGAWGEAGFTFVADFNGDGKDDIASASGSSVQMRISTGSSFRSEMWSVAPHWGGATHARVGDFDGNGLPDIASPSGGQVYLKLSTGISFTSVTWDVANAWGGGGYTWAADFNNDGRTDLASASGGVVYMKLSQGNRFSSEAWAAGSANQWGGAGYTWVMDYDGDGRKDIVSGTPGALYIKRNNNGIGFVGETWTISGSWGGPEFTWGSDRF